MIFVRPHDMTVNISQIASQSALSRGHLPFLIEITCRATTARRPHNDHHSSTEMTDCNHAQLAIVPAVIRKIQRVALENLRSILEIEPTLRKRYGAFRRIAGDLHPVN